MEKVRYNCVSGYYDGDTGEHEIGDELEGIGPVQSILTPCDECGELDCIC